MEKYHMHNRPNREIKNDSEIIQMLKNGKYVTIAMCNENEPYIVTLSYGYSEADNSLYFHCSDEGLKLDFINANPLVCATIIEDGGYVLNECAHEYKSLVFWGEMNQLSNIEEKKHGMKILLQHLEDDSAVINKKLLASDNYYSKMEVVKLEIGEIHAKAGR